MSTDGTGDGVLDVSVPFDADQHLDQAVVAEHMSAAQSPLNARETVVAHRTFSRVLQAVLLLKGHLKTVALGNRPPSSSVLSKLLFPDQLPLLLAMGVGDMK